MTFQSLSGWKLGMVVQALVLAIGFLPAIQVSARSPNEIKEEQRGYKNDIAELEKEKSDLKKKLRELRHGKLDKDKEYKADKCNSACNPKKTPICKVAVDEMLKETYGEDEKSKEAYLDDSTTPICKEIYDWVGKDLTHSKLLGCKPKLLECGLVKKQEHEKDWDARIKEIEVSVKELRKEMEGLDTEAAESYSELYKTCPTCALQQMMQPREMTGMEFGLGLAQTLAPVLMGGINGLAYWGGVNKYFDGYNGYLNTCVQIGIPCMPPGYGMGGGYGGIGGYGGGLGGYGGGLGGIGGWGGLGGGGFPGMGGIGFPGISGGIYGGIGFPGMGGGFPGMGGIGFPGMGGIGGGIGFPGMGGGFPGMGGIGGGIGFPGMGGGFPGMGGIGGGIGFPGMGGIGGGIGFPGMGGIGGGIGFPGMGGIGGGIGFPGMGGIGGGIGGYPGLGGGGLGGGLGGFGNAQYQAMLQASLQFQMQQAQRAAQLQQDLMVAQQQMLEAQMRYQQSMAGGGIGGSIGIGGGALGF